MNYDIALEKLLIKEGLYDFNPNDSGKETFRGISRINNPNWKGWEIIDNYKKNTNGFYDFLYRIRIDNLLMTLVSDFYKTEYWNKLKGDDFKCNNLLITKLFITSVNTYITTAVKILQTSINCIFGVKLKVDGIVGYNVINTCNNLSTTEVINVMNVFKILQGKYYLESIDENPKNREFINGWINRALD